MESDVYVRAKKANDRVGILLVSIFLIWLPVYLLFVRPALNNWLAQYINSYPAAFHLVPIIGLPVLVGWVLAKKYPVPKAARGHGSTNSHTP